jgi:hypothetical protein
METTLVVAKAIGLRIRCGIPLIEAAVGIRFTDIDIRRKANGKRAS